MQVYEAALLQHWSNYTSNMAAAAIVDRMTSLHPMQGRSYTLT